ncbi:MAG: hypothetical protein VYE15_02890, partial [Myxococcota bacterium]|nr:hypothetical protein [Myxococcota bacterium]
MEEGIHISRRAGGWLVAVVALGTYANTIGHQFTWDDHYNVVNNEAIRDLGNLPQLWTQAWGSQASESMNQGINANYWRPVVLTLFSIDYALFGLDPLSFHASNVLWHALACVLLWLLAVRLVPTRGPPRWGLLFGALAFAVHPLHTEAVNVITYRTDLVAGVCTLGALLAWLGVSGERGEASARRGVFLWAPLLYALGVGSKELAVTVPVLVALLDLLFPPHPLSLRDRAVRLAPMGLVLVGYLGIRAALLSPSDYSYFGDSPPSVVLFTMLGVFGMYARLLLVPWPLNPFYDWSALPFEPSLFAPRPLLGLLMLVLWFGAIAWSWKRRPAVAFFLSLYLIVLFPVSQVVPVVVAMAERFLFVACAGPLMVLGIVG